MLVRPSLLQQSIGEYLTFVWGGQLYEFQSLPIGLTRSPRIVTKIMSLSFPQTKRIHYINYFYLQGVNFVDGCNNVKDTVDLFL